MLKEFEKTEKESASVVKCGSPEGSDPEINMYVRSANGAQNAQPLKEGDNLAACGQPSQSVKDGAEKNQVQKAGAENGLLYHIVLRLCFGNKRLAEIVRFAIVGGAATIVDFFVMGVVLYAFDPSLYPSFLNVFYGGGTPSVVASCVGTGVGFIFGLIVNYILSVLFVFDEKGSSKTFHGFVVFAALSAGGFVINVLGMYLCVDIAGWNEWIIKIAMTVIVLVYNYLTRKLIIFRKNKNGG